MGDAISIEQRLHDIFSGRRDKTEPGRPERESAREVEQRAVEHLYGERSTAVVRTEREPSQR